MATNGLRPSTGNTVIALPLFTIPRAGFNLYEIGKATGIIGWEDVAQALLKIVPKMLAKAHKIDHDALDEMVALAKSRVASDTGTLLNGITSETTDEGSEFRASAVHTGGKGKQSEDYAHLVEFGHHAGAAHLGNATIADDAFFGSAAGPARIAKPAKSITAIPPHPFFYKSADEVLEKRGLAMQDVITQSGSEDGWQT